MHRFFLIIALVSLSVLAQEVVFEDSFENHPPVIVSSPPTAASPGSPYNYDVEGEDIDGDTLLYLLTTSPTGMTIDPVSGLIQWTPDTLGTYSVTVDVSDGQGAAATQSWDIEVMEIVDSDGDGLSDDDEAIAGTDPNDPDTDDDGVLDGAEVDTHGTDPLDPDTDGDNFLDGSELAVGTDPLDPEDFPDVPPDPASVAPGPDPSVAGNVRDSTVFLYTGPDPIQTGVAEDTIDLVRAALLRGTVLTRLGAPLPGVVVSILGHPEFGSTMSRADGMFDMVVNGGSPLTIDYQLTGFLPAQRTVEADWQQWLVAPDVAMIPLDPVVTPVDLAAPGDMKVARGSMQTDDDGSRQATVLFPQGVAAELRMPDDSTMPISNLSVRATEYTVGDGGELAMPAGLPPTSGYTYAVELSVDEAMTMGASSVEFDQPIPFYVENFLGFPAGTPVPTGYYDRNLGAWVPAPNGLVIKIISETGGLADIDINGDDVADAGVPLDDLGVTDTERAQIASLYEPGQSLWRVPVEHFTAWDHNWPIGPPADAVYPSVSEARGGGDLLEDGICEISASSFIECQNQVLRERVPITGTPLTLNYNSSRTPGFVAAWHLDIPVTDDSIPASLNRVDLRVAFAGQVHEFTYDAVPGLTQALTWDALDGFGRPLQGSTEATVRIGNVYEGVYRSGGSGSAIFGQPGSLPIEAEGNKTRANIILPREYKTTIGSWDGRGQGLGGWTLNVHHAYDPHGQILYRGDGTRRSAEHFPAVLDIVAGLLDEEGYAVRCYPNQDPTCGEGLPAREASLAPVDHIAFGPDGTLYFTQSGLNQVRRIGPSGIVENFAGTGESYVSGQDGSLSPNGDGGPALDAKLADPYSIAVDAYGNVFIGEFNSFAKRIRKVDTNGIITTFAGTGNVWPPIGPALEVAVWPLDIEIDADGNLYVTDYCHIFRIDPGGQSSIIAGSEDPDICDENTGDGGPAKDASIGAEGIALGPDGSIYLTESYFGSVRKISKDGTIQTIAGTGTRGFSGDGGPALNAQFDYLYDLAVTAEGGIYVPDPLEEARLRYIDTDGIVRTVGGTGFDFDVSGMFGPATNAWLYPFYVTLGPDGNPYLPLGGNDSSIRVIRSPMSGLGAGDLLVPSEDGSEVYRFNDAGRHLQTLHVLTGGVLYEFGYDAYGRLTTVTDGTGNVTTIQRDGSGNATAIVGPFGQSTVLAEDANGFLETVTNPAGESLQIQSSAEGLITQMTNPRGKISSYGYDPLGRLTAASDNVGYSQTLVRSGTGGNFSVARTTGQGRTVDYEVQQPDSQVQDNFTTAPDGSQNSAQFDVATGTTHGSSATGMTRTISAKPDPRFGMQAAIVDTAEIMSPGGPGISISSTRDAELANSGDPLSLVSLSGSATIGGRTTTSAYTAASKSLQLTSPEGRVTTVVFDDIGRVVSRQFGDLAAAATAYNSLGQLESLTQGSGESARITTFAYGSDGFRSGMTDPLGREAAFDRDAAGRITTKTLPGDIDILFGYNSAGELETITPPGQPEHSFTYTLSGQVETITPPAVSGGGPTTFSYNDDRQLTGISRPGAEVVSFDYDPQGRVAAIEMSEGGMVTASYALSYGVANRLATVTGPGSQALGYGYDGDLVTSETWSGVVEGGVAWSYDNAYRLASESVTGGTTVNFSYDDDSLLTSAGSLSIVRSAANGLAQSASLGVVSDSWTYNEFGELESNSVMANATLLYGVEYARDQLGRITQKVETIGGVSDAYDYDYDLRGQLIEVKKNGAIVESFTYDDNGNRLTGTIGGLVSSGSYDEQDRLVDYGDDNYSYTPAGRLLKRTEPGEMVTYFDYDPVGNLRGATLPDTTEISYGLDGSDRRVQRAVNGTVTHQYIYDGYLPVAELDELGNVVSQFVYVGGSTPAYMRKAGVNYRIISDQAGSVRLVVNADTGAIAQRMDYDSFGEVTNDTNPGFQPFGFAGGLYDPLTQLVLFGTRDYDPRPGRWTMKDPVGFEGDDGNLYRYVGNNPVNRNDPSGLNWFDTLLGAVNGANQALQETINPALLIQNLAEVLTDYAFGDWLEENGFYRDPHPGRMYPPPPGVNVDDYLDGEFYGSCAVGVATLGLGAGELQAVRAASTASRNLDELMTTMRYVERLKASRSGQVIAKKLSDALADARAPAIRAANELRNEASRAANSGILEWVKQGWQRLNPLYSPVRF